MPGLFIYCKPSSEGLDHWGHNLATLPLVKVNDLLADGGDICNVNKVVSVCHEQEVVEND
jgi:hypothetical protein